MRALRVYLENSVIGGYFDEDFKIPTRKLFELFRKGIYIPVVSDNVFAELRNGAPKQVVDNLGTINCEILSVTDEMRELSLKYLSEKIISEKYYEDALHIAVATVSHIDILVSWNFKHIVNFNKIRLFNTVNFREGYGILDIRTPQEVIEHDK